MLWMVLPVWIDCRDDRRAPAGARWIPGLNTALENVAIDGVFHCPSRSGLLIMMCPVLVKVRYDRLDTATGDRKLLLSSLVLNWVLGPGV